MKKFAVAVMAVFASSYAFADNHGAAAHADAAKKDAAPHAEMKTETTTTTTKAKKVKKMKKGGEHKAAAEAEAPHAE